MIDWHIFVAQLITELKMAPSEAWNCTLREYVLLTTHKGKKPMREVHSKLSKTEILDKFKLMEMHNDR